MYDDSYLNEHPFPRLFILNAIEDWDLVREGDVLAYLDERQAEGWLVSSIDLANDRFMEQIISPGHCGNPDPCYPSDHVGKWAIFDCHWDSQQMQLVAGRLHDLATPVNSALPRY